MQTATTIASAMQAALSTVATDALSGIQGIVTVAIPIAGAIIAIRVIMRAFKAASR